MEFNWLHLTDLHQTVESVGRAIAWSRIKKKVQFDLAAQLERTGPIDAIVFSGDIAFKGAAKEFSRADKLLAEILAVCEGFGPTPLLLPTPGNHDLVRPKKLSNAMQGHLGRFVKEGFPPDFWSDSNRTRRALSQPFKNYETWFKKRGLHRLPGYRVGALPGDYSCSFTTNGLKIGVVSLNSTFLQVAKTVGSGELVLDPRQLTEALPTPPEEWAEAHDLRLLITHHPPSWLSPRSRESFDELIDPPGRFSLHLFGHLHKSSPRVVQWGGEAPRVQIQGASLFGVASESEKDIYGYSIGSVRWEKGAPPKARLIPRRAFKAKSDWLMQPDVDLGPDLNGAITLPVTAARMVDADLEPPAVVRHGRIAVLTTGRDAPGVNACIRALVRVAAASGLDVVGIQNGFRGLADAKQHDTMRGDATEAREPTSAVLFLSETDPRPFFFYNRAHAEAQPDVLNRSLMRKVSMIIHRGGSIIPTGRWKDLKVKKKQDGILADIVESIEKHRFTHVVVVGGRGSMRAVCLIAQALHAEGSTCRVVGIPATIENDLDDLTERSIGYDSALNASVRAVDAIRDTGEAMLAARVISVAGQDSGLLTAEVAVASGSEMLILANQDPAEFRSAVEEAMLFRRRFWGDGEVRKTTLIIAQGTHAEGPIAELEDDGDLRRPTQVAIEELTRGGAPSAIDRVLATRMGWFVAQAIASDPSLVGEALHRDPFHGVSRSQPLLASYCGGRIGWSRLELVNKKSMQLKMGESQRIERSFRSDREVGVPASQNYIDQLRQLLHDVSRSYYEE